MASCRVVLLAALLALVGAAAGTSPQGSPQGKTPPPLVQLEKGAVRGTTLQSNGGRSFFAFRGVPYARPPVGKYRFKEPKPTKPWQGVWEATSLPPKCLQFERYPDSYVHGDEDCLYLNVYTPRLPAPGAPLLDVLVYIHGGGFMYGGSADWGPEILLDKDVVLVVINYRLGPLGFLSTEDDIVPGNNGLKDQAMALRWVQGNIAAFGGNPNSVTIWGMSAGGTSVHFHYLSPLSRGLFQRGWSLSGSTFCPWSQQEAGLEKARRLAGVLGCPSDNATTRDLVECLRYRPARAVVGAVVGLQDEAELPFSPFAPVVEPRGTPGAFLDRPPVDVIREGLALDAPWMAGITTEEGLYNGAEFLGAGQKDRMALVENNWLEKAPLLLDYNYTVADKAQRDAVSQAVRDRYFGKRAFGEATPEFIAMVGDRIFNTGVERAARLMSQANSEPVYLYVFGFRGEHSLSDCMTNPRDTTNWGVSHGDDLAYLLKWSSVPTGRTPEEQTMTKQLISILTTFARTGVPSGLPGSPGWSPLDPAASDLHIMRYNANAKLTFETVPELGQSSFWESLPLQENQPEAAEPSVKAEL